MAQYQVRQAYVGNNNVFGVWEPTFIATGGEIIYDGDFIIHKFTATSTTSSVYDFEVSFSNTDNPQPLEILVVGGGAGGSRYGGGGAGGVVYIETTDNVSMEAGTYSIQVGGGGVSELVDFDESILADATNGGDSFIENATFQITGSGGGRAESSPGIDGGSGGGSRNGVGGSGIQSTLPGLSGTYGFGNDGGSQGPGQSNGFTEAGGAGGGAGEAGEPPNPDTLTGGDGGDGIESSITGTPTYYGGGGGGAGTDSPSNEPTYAGIGGLGGGGNGSFTFNNPCAGNCGDVALPGTDGLGGGGGQIAYYDSVPGYPNYNYNLVDGGSGVVMIRYRYKRS